MSDPHSVTIRARTDEDLDLLFRIAADLDTWEERNPGAPVPLTRAAYESRLAEIEGDVAHRGVLFVVVEGGAPVGSVSLFGFDDLARHAEVGISLIQEARGHGAGTAALEQIAAFAFERCNLRRLHLQAIASNLGAIRAYEKAGFVIEGRQREHAWVRGRYEDIVLMGRLRDPVED